MIVSLTIIVGLVVIASTIVAQGRINVFQNLIFKILGLTKKQIVYSSLFEFSIKFVSIIIFSSFFSIISSIYIIEKMFRLEWQFDFFIFLNVILAIGCLTTILIILTYLKYLSPKVYPLIRNE